MFRNRIFKNSVCLFSSQIVGRIIGFLYFIFLARNFSVENFGVLAWVLGFVYNFYPLADFGIERLVLKKVSRDVDKASEYLKKLLPLRFLLALGIVILATLASLSLGVGLTKAWLVFVFGLAVVPYNLLYLLAAIENAKEKMNFYAKVVVATSVLSAVLGISFIKLGFGLPWVLFGYFLGNLGVLAWEAGKIGIRPISQIGRIGWEDFAFWKAILKESWVFAVILVLAVFYLRIALILMGLVLGDYAAGIYGAASKFVEAGILIPQSIVLALFPISSRLFIEDKKKLKKIYLKGLGVLGVLGVLGGLIMFFGGRFIIPLVYGEKYWPSVHIFSTMGILIALFCVNALPGNIIQNSEKVKKFLPFAVANFLVAVVSVFILIKRMGVIGGVWGMIVGEIFGLAVNNWFVYKILKS